MHYTDNNYAIHVAYMWRESGEASAAPLKQSFGHWTALHVPFELVGYYFCAFRFFLFYLFMKLPCYPNDTKLPIVNDKKPPLSKAKFFTFQEQWCNLIVWKLNQRLKTQSLIFLVVKGDKIITRCNKNIKR
jgi:hypothetical protein